MNAENATQSRERLTVRRFGLPLQPDGSGQPLDGDGVVADSGIRNAYGHRIVSVERARGSVLWLAVCDQHRWLSGPDCEGSACPGCEAEQAATRSRQRFLAVYDSALLAEIFRAA